MNRNEDYLDNLLTSVTDKLNEFDDDFQQSRESLKKSYQTRRDLPQRPQSALDEIRGDNFLREFDHDMQSGMTEEDFIHEFEQELKGEADSFYDLPQADNYVNQIDEIMDQAAGAGADSTQQGAGGPSGGDPVLDDIFQEGGQPDPLLEDIFGGDAQSDAGLEDIFEEDTQTEQMLEDIFGDDSRTVSMPQGAPAEDVQTVAMSQGAPAEDVRTVAMPDGAAAAPAGMEGLEDIFGGAPSGGASDNSVSQEEIDSMLRQAAQSDSPGQAPGAAAQSADPGLDQILNESDDDAIAEIGRMLNNGEDSGSYAGGPDFSYEESVAGQEEESGRKRKKERNPDGLFAKLSRILFGSPEELNPELAAQIAAARGNSPEENLDPKELKERKKQEKELKKQQKKEAAEQAKKEKEAAKAEKAAKKAAQQASKPKKEKKPKEKLPKEPPLPKVPVVMMWTIALSIMVLVFLGASLLGYSSPVSESKEAFDSGDYVMAYAKLQGVKVKKTDEDLYYASEVLAGVQTELDAYTALMEQKQYEMALDALVRGFGRCQLHAAKAEEWGVSGQLEQLDLELGQLLKDQFDVSRRKAKKLYNIDKRSDYTMELHKILEGLGLY